MKLFCMPTPGNDLLCQIPLGASQDIRHFFSQQKVTRKILIFGTHAFHTLIVKEGRISVSLEYIHACMLTSYKTADSWLGRAGTNGKTKRKGLLPKIKSALNLITMLIILKLYYVPLNHLFKINNHSMVNDCCCQHLYEDTLNCDI